MPLLAVWHYLQHQPPLHGDTIAVKICVAVLVIALLLLPSLLANCWTFFSSSRCQFPIAQCWHCYHCSLLSLQITTSLLFIFPNILHSVAAVIYIACCANVHASSTADCWCYHHSTNWLLLYFPLLLLTLCFSPTPLQLVYLFPLMPSTTTTAAAPKPVKLKSVLMHCCPSVACFWHWNG